MSSKTLSVWWIITLAANRDSVHVRTCLRIKQGNGEHKERGDICTGIQGTAAEFLLEEQGLS